MMKHEMRLYGPIGGWGITAEEVLDSIPAKATDITVRIHSPGGSVGEGLAIYHGLRDHPANVVTIVDGYAASIASLIMLAGDERQVHRNSLVFVHNPWTEAAGNANELRKMAEDLDVHTEALLDIYLQRTGMGEQDLRDMMDGESFFRGVDAMDNGFATSVIDNPTAEARIAAMLTVEKIAASIQEPGRMTAKESREKNAALETQVQAMTEAATVLAAQVAADIDAAREQSQNELSVANDARDEALAATVAVQTELDSTLETVADLTGKLTDADKSATAARDEIAGLKATIESPAYKDAALTAADEAAQAKLDAEADEAEKAAQAKLDAEKEDAKGTWEDYADLPQDEKHAYFNAHRTELIEAAKNQ